MGEWEMEGVERGIGKVKEKCIREEVKGMEEMEVEGQRVDGGSWRKKTQDIRINFLTFI